MENQINLAPQDKLASSILGKLLTWSLSAGRIIVVFTELVVISAFLSRFFLDNQLRSLNSSIEQKSAIITASADFEKNFRELQNRILLASTIAASQTPSQDFLLDIETLLPQPVYITQLSLNDHLVSLAGIAPSEASLTQLLKNLKTHPRLSNISLGQLSTEVGQSQGIEFTVTANWQPAPIPTREQTPQS